MIDFPDPLPVRVDFAFGADPDVTPDEGQWTTVPDDHWISQSIAISRGRQNEEDQVQAASWSFQLLNDSGNYTPELVTSPHYPHLKLGLPCRIRVGSMVRAVGNVAEITPEWPAGDIDPGHSLVRVTVGGFLRRLGQGELPANSALHRYFTNHPDTIAYWPFEDASGATSVASPIRGVSPIRLGDHVELGSGQGIPGGSQSGLLRVQPGAMNVMGTVPPHPPTDAYTATILFRQNDATVTGFRSAMTMFSTSTTARQWRVRVSSTQALLIAFDVDGTEVVTDTQSISPLLFGRWVFITLALHQSGSAVDWSYSIRTADAAATVLNSASGSLASSSLGRITQLGPATGRFGAAPDERFYGHAALRSGFETAAVPAVHGYTGELAADRFERLCEEERLRCTVIGTAADTMPMGPQRPDTLVAQLQEIADTDGGILAESREVFGFEYRTRVSMYNQEPALELDAGTFPGDITHPFTPTLDDQQIRNDVTAQQAGGSSARVVDLADIDDRGHFAGDLTVNVHGDSRLAQVASWRLHHGTYPGMRYPSISPGLTQVPDLISEWVTVELGDRVRAFGLPDEHPVDDVDLLMQGYVETLEPQGWHIEANASPARPWNVFELEHPTFGRLWSPRAYLGEDIDDSATSFEVIVPVQQALNFVSDFESPFTVGDSVTTFDWAEFGGTFERSSEQSFTGRWSGKFTPDGVEAFPVFQIRSGVGVAAGGLSYRGSAWLFSPVGGFDVRLNVLFVGANGGTISTATGTTDTLAADTWTRYVTSGTSPAGTVAVQLQLIYMTSTPAVTDVLFTDDAEVGRPDAPFEEDTGLSTPIIIGGERMTVTAIGADDGTGAQAFTVTRSVNGITKSHVAGAPVRLWPGHVMGL